MSSSRSILTWILHGYSNAEPLHSLSFQAEGSWKGSKRAAFSAHMIATCRQQRRQAAAGPLPIVLVTAGLRI